MKKYDKEELIAILLRSVEEWNILRDSNPILRPDLSGVDLPGANLKGARLFEANLHVANLHAANLSRANLSKATLIAANLSGANFHRAYLIAANLHAANLSRANLYEADLRGATLDRANLSEAKLLGADLSLSSLSYSNLSGSDLSGSDLRHANLLYSNLTGANLSGVKLWANVCNDWQITDVICTHIYDDESGKNRVPPDRDFEPGEFEKLYAKLPSFEYLFKNGFMPIDTIIMDRVTQEINRQNPDFEIEMTQVSMSSKQGMIPSIQFTVKNERFLEKAEQEISRKYEKANTDLNNNLLGQQGQIKALEKMIDKYIPKNQNITITTGDNSPVQIGDGTQTFDQQVNQSGSLSDDTKELLLKIYTELQKNNAPPASQTELDTIKMELEKPAPDKGILKKSWDGLVAATPTLAKWYDIFKPYLDL